VVRFIGTEVIQEKKRIEMGHLAESEDSSQVHTSTFYRWLALHGFSNLTSFVHDRIPLSANSAYCDPLQAAYSVPWIPVSTWRIALPKRELPDKRPWSSSVVPELQTLTLARPGFPSGAETLQQAARLRTTDLVLNRDVGLVALLVLGHQPAPPLGGKPLPQRQQTRTLDLNRHTLAKETHAGKGQVQDWRLRADSLERHDKLSLLCARQGVEKGDVGGDQVALWREMPAAKIVKDGE
jgi:hypothetical protein